MKFEKVMELLVSTGYPITSITFKSKEMEHWYVPKELKPSSSADIPRLICSSPTRRDLARWDWSSSARLKNCTVLKIEVKTVNLTKRSLIKSSKIVSITLKEPKYG